ncbi:MAG: peptidylprolyl isomerase [Microcoleaceae cyanobacterium]
MTTKPLLVIGEAEVSLAQALGYLQASGKLQDFIGAIVRQHVIDQELRSHPEYSEIDSNDLQQAISNFRNQNQLTDPQIFQEWLDKNGSNYGMLESQVANSLRLQKLGEGVMSSFDLNEYFQQRKPALDSVILSRIVVQDQELAEALNTKLKTGEAQFEQLAKEYSIANERTFNGLMGSININTLPEILKIAVVAAAPGNIVGPFLVDNFWCLFRVEELQLATLENANVRKKLQNELFERWIGSKLQDLTIKLQVGE